MSSRRHFESSKDCSAARLHLEQSNNTFLGDHTLNTCTNVKESLLASLIFKIFGSKSILDIPKISNISFPCYHFLVFLNFHNQLQLLQYDSYLNHLNETG